MTLSTLCLSILGGIGSAYTYAHAQGYTFFIVAWLIAGIAVTGHHLALLDIPLFGITLVGSWFVHLILLCRKTL